MKHLLSSITQTDRVYHLEHVVERAESGALVSCESLHGVLSLSLSRRHDPVCGVARGFGRGYLLRSCFAETLLPILLERRLLSAEGDQVRAEAGAVQAHLQRVHGPGQVRPAGGTHPPQAVRGLRWTDPHLPGHRAAQQQVRSRVPRQTRPEERRLRRSAHEQRARLSVRVVRVGEGRLLGGFSQHEHQVQVSAALLQQLRSQNSDRWFR